mgnify:CR=1 FL=1
MSIALLGVGLIGFLEFLKSAVFLVGYIQGNSRTIDTRRRKNVVTENE